MDCRIREPALQQQQVDQPDKRIMLLPEKQKECSGKAKQVQRIDFYKSTDYE